ncbi:MAG: DUF6382 domain-containing protein [Lachnospiraceae bacterium]|nr:DUF6382 domain-containing protein [Lachnospiraceae bacterium]
MIQTKTIHELNHTYLIITGDCIEKTDDFRYRMLLSNCMEGVIPMQIRVINGEREVYFDITEREPVAEYYKGRPAGRDDIRLLLEAVFRVSSNIEKFLIDEGNLIMRPELIYRNVKSGGFEFICFPDNEREGGIKEEPAKELMRFLTGCVDTGDELLTECIYGLYDMAAFKNVNFATLYETYMGEMKETKLTKESPEEEQQENWESVLPPEKGRKIYIPSLKEWGAALLGVTGMALIGLNLYSSFLH